MKMLNFLKYMKYMSRNKEQLVQKLKLFGIPFRNLLQNYSNWFQIDLEYDSDFVLSDANYQVNYSTQDGLLKI